MQTKNLVIAFLCMFFTVITSVIIHEQIHVFQLSSAGYEITDICYLAYNEDGSMGWVKFRGEGTSGLLASDFDDLSSGEKELEAYVVQIIYSVLVHVSLYNYLKGDKNAVHGV